MGTTHKLQLMGWDQDDWGGEGGVAGQLQHVQVEGVGGGRGNQFPGSGGTLAPRSCAKVDTQ